MNNRFSENLKNIRKENHLSQEQLADELGVSRQAISKWESSTAYPEMDKIIMLCDKFNVNIDDLLHRDIKEVKGEEESKRKVNDIVNDFLKFITNSVNLFCNMSFKSKVKCIIEQLIIVFVLVIASHIIINVFTSFIFNIFSFIPNRANYFINNILESVLSILFFIASVVIVANIFKTRYLDYYVKAKEEIKEENNNSNKKIELKKEEKIIIRDPKHSEHKLVNAFLKCIILVIKFFLICFALSIVATIIGLFAALVTSFLLYNTGAFFIGLLLSILSSSVIAIIILLLIINFVFNRKNNKKSIIWSFIVSLVVFGIGCGLLFIGTLNFDISEENPDMLKTETIEYEMKDNLIIQPQLSKVEYVVEDIETVKLDYSFNKYCEIESYTNDEGNIIHGYVDCKNSLKLIREQVKYINKNKKIPVSYDIEKITIHASQENIDKLKNNLENYYQDRYRE